MRLTPDQHAHLYELHVSVCRPTDETPTLVKLGLAIQGSGRFGEWARITSKGRDLVMKTSSGTRATANGTAIAVKDGPRSTPDGVERPSQAAPNPRRQDLKARRETRRAVALSPPIFSAEAANPPPVAPRKAGAINQPSGSAKGSPRASPRPSYCQTPNAVRTIKGSRVTYFPVGMYTSINDETKQRVVTTNKCFRSYSLDASKTDDVVL